MYQKVEIIESGSQSFQWKMALALGLRNDPLNVLDLMSLLKSNLSLHSVESSQLFKEIRLSGSRMGEYLVL